MKKAGEVLKSIIIIVVLLAVGFAVGFFFKDYLFRQDAEATGTSSGISLPGEVEKRVVTIDEVKVILSETSEFSTYSCQYSVEKSADYSRYFLDNIVIPGTKNVVTINCDGIVKVGYDVKKIDVRIDNESRTIYISLPDAAVNDNHIIWDTVNVNEKNNILNPIDFSQYQELIGEIEAEGLEKAEASGVYEKAEENFKTIITNFLSGLDDYKVEFI